MITMTNLFSLIFVITCFVLINIVVWLVFYKKQQQSKQLLTNQEQTINNLTLSLNQFILQDQQYKQLKDQQLPKLQQDLNNTLQQFIQQNMQDIRTQLQTSLAQHANTLEKPLKQLTTNVENRLRAIGEQVDKRLSGGFEKTNSIFTQVIERLSKIDAAQKRITELSANIVDLQSLLSDKRSRGAFGEVQLENLIKNSLPPQHFKLQYTLANSKRVDCLLQLPPPTGNIAIDAKFPLESYQLMYSQDIDSHQRTAARQQFKRDIQLHINCIAEKYILPPHTSDGAIMFIPAEAVFSEIHAHFPELVAYSQKKRVWITSPTTMMAILTTASAVLKDVATRQQVHIIQQHLNLLSMDFDRFQKRMEALSKHINMVQKDADQVTISSKKIANRFTQIEQVEIPDDAPTTQKVESLETQS